MVSVVLKLGDKRAITYHGLMRMQILIHAQPGRVKSQGICNYDDDLLDQDWQIDGLV